MFSMQGQKQMHRCVLGNATIARGVMLPREAGGMGQVAARQSQDSVKRLKCGNDPFYCEILLIPKITQLFGSICFFRCQYFNFSVSR